MVEGLLAAILVLVVVLIVLVWTTRGIKRDDVETAISKSWIGLGLGERIRSVELHAERIDSSYRSFEQLLRVPTERASFGELSLETMLADQLPSDMFMIRKRVADGHIPDAAIRSTVGLICIDSKFPLDNYARMLECDGDEAAALQRRFARDVRGHLEKIASDYVFPQRGSAEFAFAYVPSESVYYYLVNQAFDLLREYTRRGVQVVSPLTLSQKVELIKAGVHARRLSENAEKVSNDLQTLARCFAEVDEAWRVYYDTHLRNLVNKSEDLDRAYRGVREAFDRIARLE